MPLLNAGTDLRTYRKAFGKVSVDVGLQVRSVEIEILDDGILIDVAQ